MAKQSAPTKYYEIVDKKSSGFILDGTEGTQFQQELVAPSVQWISSTSMTAEERIMDGKKTKHYLPIRYINRCDIIDPVEQDAKGFKTNRFEDKIAMESGFMTVVREGSTIGLYDYLEKSFFNLDNPDRPTDVPARYREIRLDKKAVELLDEDEQLTQAKSMVYALRLNTGDKKTPYKYNNDKIDAMCRLVNVWDETPERKLILLLQRANQNPKSFLEVVVAAEQTVITEVSHALELSVINFDKNTAQFSEGNKILTTLEGSNLKPDQKIEKLASWLSTEEGNFSLTEMRARLEIAKEKIN